jgi:protein-S-isoprenylcysteine O-methyltransferase Ste14
MASQGVLNLANSGTNKMPEKRFSWTEYFPVTFASILFISQIVIGIYLLPEVSQIEVLAYVGVGLYVFSGLIFGMLPVLEFRKKGGVSKGQSYIHTTKLVDTGIYSIVRHPQYVTFMMWAIAGMLLFQHWIIILLGVPIFPLTYIDLIKADKDAVEKFGDVYKAYVKKVPRANFLLGILRLMQRRRKQS